MRINIVLSAVLALQVFIWALSGVEDSTPSSIQTSLSRIMGESGVHTPQLRVTEAQEWLKKRGFKVSDTAQLATALGLSEPVLKATLESTELSADQREEIECGAAFKEIQRIEITEGKEEGAVGKPTVISLEQAQDQWVVGSAHRYPVSLDKVHALIKRLLKIDLRVIIGRRPENHARLRVASNAYDRFIKLNIAGREVKLYVGNGKGQTLHLRFDGDDRVYRVKGLSLWSDLSVAITSYVDTSYLKVDELSALTLSGPDQRELKLTSKDGQWSLAGVEPTELDQGKVIALVDQARELSLTDVVGTEARKEYRLDQGVKVSLTPLAKEGAPSAPVNYRVGLDDQGTYYAQREGSTFIIKITSYKGKDLFEKTAETLLTEAAIEARKAPVVTEEPTSSEPTLNLEGLDTAEPSPLVIPDSVVSPDPVTPQNPTK